MTAPTVDPEMARWLEWVADGQGRSVNTLRAYETGIRMWCAYLATRRVEPMAAGRSEATGWLKTLGSAYSAETVNSRLTPVRQFYLWAIDEELLTRTPFQGLQGHKVPHREPETLSLDEICRMIDACQGKHAARSRAVIALLAYSGCRISEIVNMRVADIDLGEGYALVTGKGDKQRWVPIRECAEHLERWLWERLRYTKHASEYVFPSAHGTRPCRPPFVYKAITDAADAANLGRKVNPHMFRASFATRWDDAGVSSVAIQRTMGHASANTTGRYIKHTPARVVQAAAQAAAAAVG